MARDRRRAATDFRGRPRPSPASMVPLAFGAMVVAVAATTAVLGGGEARTPHDRLVAALEEVADAQEEHYHETGTFVGWSSRLALVTDPEVELTQLRGDQRRWNAVVRVPGARLFCARSGGQREGRLIRGQATCYTVDE